MLGFRLRNFQARLLLFLRFLSRTKGIWLRAGVCLTVGCSILFLENSQNFDLRFQLRRSQAIDEHLIVLNISLSDWERLLQPGRNYLRPLRDFTSPDDSFFWNESLWTDLLGKILSVNPQAVIVSFFFPQPVVNQRRMEILGDPRIFWLTQRDSEGRLQDPLGGKVHRLQVGELGLRGEDDRVVRKTSMGSTSLAYDLTHRLKPEQPFPSESHPVLNFRGHRKQIPHLNFNSLLSRSFNLDSLKDKIILIGTSDVESHLFQTPVGDMSRSEILAVQIDNLLNNRFIKQFPRETHIAILIFLLFIAIALMSSYPQSIAFVFLLWISVGWTAFSIWIFDTYYYWLPIFAPLFQTGVAYVIFLGYQLTIKENEAWRLEQEKKYLSEIEQLKNNFVSLISHDLKTPIAKIQAICDRLLAKNPSPDLSEGLFSLRNESSELNRYIQTILKVSRAESKDFRLNKEATDINEVIEAVIQQLQTLLHQKQLKLTLELEPIFSIEIDSILMHEVILNLIENAIKYTPEGGSIRVLSQEVESEVLVIVEDTGPGISDVDQKRVFEKFYRTADQEHNSKGTGLGLYLVKYFVELHHGRVFLESSPGKGTRVGFRLPTDVESDQVTEPMKDLEENS